jgi:uncharacterized damage-inducible protein DinB
MMTLPEILDLFEFDKWAIGRTMESVSAISEGKYLEDLKSSHGGIHGTFVHIHGANVIWLKRWKGGSPSKSVTVDEIPNLESLKARWEEYYADLANYLGNLNEEKISAFLSYNDLKGSRHSEPLFQQMQHLINHSSYHRGQIVTMLRQVEAKPMGTDLISFYRTKMKPSAK